MVLPEGLVSIGEEAFALCGAADLYGAYYPAFSFCAISLPSTLKTIGPSAFSHCQSLSSIDIPNGVTCIEEYTFAQCYGLKSIKISANIATIEKGAFNGCKYLNSITFKWAAPAMDSKMCGVQVVANCYYPSNNAAWTSDLFQDYGGDLTWIGQEMEKPEGAGNSDSGNTGEEEDDSGNSSDGSGDAGDTPGGSTGGNTNQDSSGSCGENSAWNYDASSGTLTISGSGPMADILWEFQYREDLYAYRPDWYAYRDFIRTLKVEEGITHLGAGTFYQFPALTSVTLPASIASVGNRAFDGCGALSTVCFSGNAPETIGSYIFRGCTDDFTILYPDGAAGWTSPLWNGWPAAHSVQKDGVLTHCAAVPTGTRAILVTFGDNGRMLSCSSVIWDKSPLVTLPLPASREAVSMQLFYLNSASAPFRAENDLTDFVL